MKSLIVLLSFLAVSLFSPMAFAGPVRCSYGFEDSTCAPDLYAAAQPAPACSTSAGWTTTASAQWIGSRWTSPSCNYQAPPTCSAGSTQTQAPSWNGSSWVGLGCAPNPGGGGTGQAAQQQACINTAAAYGRRVSTPSAFVGPQSETTSQVVNDMNTQPPPRICQQAGSSWAGGTTGDLPPTNGPYDVYKLGFLTYVLTNSNAGDEGTTYNVSSQIMACMLNPGTTQVVGFRLAQSQTTIGGPCGR
ncbi:MULTISPECIES: hypothetical protein [Burkholderia cepacia complex]|uniref:hypothetical protein n=1 Tax=Burkholderia cepacia complex TaxID=87882 RepID=UPI000A739A98|nr:MULTISPECIES: hypothetical protein [Burkholderia cepacia complex]QTO47441.1 hypothetical protein J8I86_10415 [Burkholderia latens]